MKPTTPLVLSLLLAFPAAAQFCDLNLRYENGQIQWKAITGASRYTVLKSFGDLKPPEFLSTRNTFIAVDERASAPVRVRYIVTAEVESGVRIAATWTDACSGTIDITLPVDPAFRKFTRRAVIPVVGSTPGAFGGQFKTALELRGVSTEKGRLVFHPAGRVASDSDPSIPYSFTTGNVIKFDDVVAAMGQSGIGSLDIVLDEDSLDRIPQVIVRLYNDTSLGTFGTYASAVLPYDYLRPATFQVRVPDARFRLNMGVRALADTKMSVIVQREDGRLDGLRERVFAAGYMEMRAVADFLGRTVEPGSLLTVSFEGAAVPFYTITENQTNDPTLVVPPARGTSRDVSEFVD